MNPAIAARNHSASKNLATSCSDIPLAGRESRSDALVRGMVWGMCRVS